MLQYPQYIFFNEILKLATTGVKAYNHKSGVDIPCGSGYTTHYLSEKSNLKWLGVDIDESSINYAKTNYQNEKANFEQGDIFSKLNELKNVDVLCVINSIFLLPNHDKLFDLVSSCLSSNGGVYFIIPNIRSINYRNFTKNNPNVNIKEYEPKELAEELKKYGLTTKTIRGICYANIYGRKEIRFMRRFSHHYLTFLNYLMTFFKIGTPSYFLIEAKK